jgi:AraC-like DNA-binding protein
VTYRERPSSIAGATVWSRVADGTSSWILPDGCMDLIWDGSSLFTAGPDTGPHLATAAAGTPYTALRFAPGIGPAVFGLPADALRDQRVPLEQLWTSDAVDRVVDELQANADGGPVLEAVVADRLRRADPDPVAHEVARLVDRGHSVAEVAAAVGLSDRQLHRRSLAAFGYGPKVLARILRLQRALDLARSGRTFSTTAAEAGYADQAHLAREVRALAGAPLSQLVD